MPKGKPAARGGAAHDSATQTSVGATTLARRKADTELHLELLYDDAAVDSDSKERDRGKPARKKARKPAEDLSLPHSSLLHRSVWESMPRMAPTEPELAVEYGTSLPVLRVQR